MVHGKYLHVVHHIRLLFLGSLKVLRFSAITEPIILLLYLEVRWYICCLKLENANFVQLNLIACHRLGGLSVWTQRVA